MINMYSFYFSIEDLQDERLLTTIIEDNEIYMKNDYKNYTNDSKEKNKLILNDNNFIRKNYDEIIIFYFDDTKYHGNQGRLKLAKLKNI